MLFGGFGGFYNKNNGNNNNNNDGANKKNDENQIKQSSSNVSQNNATLSNQQNYSQQTRDLNQQQSYNSSQQTQNQNTQYNQTSQQENKENQILDNNKIVEESSQSQQNNNQNQSHNANQTKGGFADRYQSRKGDLMQKSSFTSQNLEKKTEQESSGSYSGSVEQKSSNPPRKVDPQKKILANLIYLVKGVDDGRNAWYYVLVERLKVNMFLKALNDDIIHLENYGKILYSAYGDEPPKEVTDALKEEYGIEG